MIRIFLSYSSHDKEVATWLAEVLRANGAQVWFAEWKMRPGDSIPQAISEGMELSDYLVLLLSNAAVASKWVTEEMSAAIYLTVERGGFVLPVLLEECPLPPLLKHRRAIKLMGDREAAIPEIVSMLADGSGATSVTDPGSATPAAVSLPVPPALSTPPAPVCHGGRKEIAPAPAPGEPDNVPSNRLPSQGGGAEFRYRNLYRIASLRLPYVVLFNSWQKSVHEYRQGDVDAQIDSTRYQLPELFRANDISPRGSDAKCRLVSYQFQIGSRTWPTRLRFIFSPITYDDYLRSGEHLDEPVPGDPDRTFRDLYAPEIGPGRNLAASPLTNICGVGIFLITRDTKVLISKHSADVAVCGNVFSYSASGTMDWGEFPHPFQEVARECVEEIGHHVNPDAVRLFALGVDAKRLYYQFSFFERTARSSQDILDEAINAPDFQQEMEVLEAVPFELDAVLARLTKGEWEPAAAAALLTLCAKEFDHDRVERAIDAEFVSRRWRDEMVAEWRERASRPGDQAVMSARYPLHRLAEESAKYAEAVHRFLGQDVTDKDVLEVGCGNGRLTKGLVSRAERLTCLDISEEMIELNRQRLGGRSALVKYWRGVAQDYRPANRHDVVISSLVLVHNVDDRAFQELVQVMCACADTIFLFEHVGTTGRMTSATRVRSEEELRTAFQGYEVERHEEYLLFEDRLLFLKLVRRLASRHELA